MAMCENWQLFVHDGRHNHAIGVCSHRHTQAVKLTEKQLIQIEQFRKSHVPPRNILRFFREQNVGCSVSSQKIYNIVAKIKKNRMQGQNTVEEVLCLSTIQDYTVFYRNHEDSNMLSDIVVAHPTSIEMLRTWPYVLIMDTTYKTNNAFMRNEQATTYRWVLQQIKHLYFSNTMSTENQEDVCETMPKASLEFSRTKEKHNAKSNHIFYIISTGPISKVREMRRLAKGVLNLVLPEDPGVTLTSPPEVAVTKGRKKTDSIKRDKSHWEYVSIAHQKIQKLSGSVSGSGTRSGLLPVRVLGQDPVGEGDRHELLGKGQNFVFGDEHQWPEVRRGMLYELEHSTNLYVNLVGSEERVNELVHRINWLLGSTTMLPLYSYSDHPEGTLVISFLTEERHFIQLNDMCPIPPLHFQWIHYRSEWVSNWADSYQHRIADWNARVSRNRK
ncbi:hypothetical protein M9H77_22538 [Catharanthus roseus]|uniref:Uncharacterized protein n=1 Tax=Catharanthus roseus TaxID=4058 RepID=A0ACC0ASH1_CATRO|nr:hypothetical protein M9H77_22538 [Catharanthus roseus]